eukprot:gene3306-2288_t
MLLYYEDCYGYLVFDGLVGLVASECIVICIAVMVLGYVAVCVNGFTWYMGARFMWHVYYSVVGVILLYLYEIDNIGVRTCVMRKPSVMFFNFEAFEQPVTLKICCSIHWLSYFILRLRGQFAGLSFICCGFEVRGFLLGAEVDNSNLQFVLLGIGTFDVFDYLIQGVDCVVCWISRVYVVCITVTFNTGASWVISIVILFHLHILTCRMGMCLICLLFYSFKLVGFVCFDYVLFMLGACEACVVMF